MAGYIKHHNLLTLSNFLTDDSPCRLPKQSQIFTRLGFRYIDLNNPKLTLCPTLIRIFSLPLSIAKRNELSIMNSDGIEPFKLFFIIVKEGL